MILITCPIPKVYYEKIKITDVINVGVNLQSLSEMITKATEDLIVEDLVKIVVLLNNEIEVLKKRVTYLEGVCFDNDGK